MLKTPATGGGIKAKPKAKPTAKAIRTYLGADWHAGGFGGLNHPRFIPGLSANPRWMELAQRNYSRFCEFIDKHGPFDLLLFAGDGIEGNMRRGTGSELLIPSQNDQKWSFKELLKRVGAPRIRAATGTPYHVNGAGDAEWERIAIEEMAAEGYDAKISDRWVGVVNGCRIDLCHKVSTADNNLVNEIRQARMWTEDGIPMPDLMIRGHVHRYDRHTRGRTTAVSLPAMQLWTSYGARECRKPINHGQVAIDIHPGGRIEWVAVELDNLCEWQLESPEKIGS